MTDATEPGTVKLIFNRSKTDFAAFVTDEGGIETRVRFKRRWVPTCDEHGVDVHCPHVEAAMEARSGR